MKSSVPPVYQLKKSSGQEGKKVPNFQVFVSYDGLWFMTYGFTLWQFFFCFGLWLIPQEYRKGMLLWRLGCRAVIWSRVGLNCLRERRFTDLWEAKAWGCRGLGCPLLAGCGECLPGGCCPGTEGVERDPECRGYPPGLPQWRSQGCDWP